MVTASTISCLWLSANREKHDVVSTYTRRSSHAYKTHSLLTGARTVDFADDVRHSRFVAHEGGQVRRLARVVFGKRLDLAAVALGPLPRQKAQGAVAWSGELPVGLWKERGETDERTVYAWIDRPREEIGGDRLLTIPTKAQREKDGTHVLLVTYYACAPKETA